MSPSSSSTTFRSHPCPKSVPVQVKLMSMCDRGAPVSISWERGSRRIESTLRSAMRLILVRVMPDSRGRSSERAVQSRGGVVSSQSCVGGLGRLHQLHQSHRLPCGDRYYKSSNTTMTLSLVARDFHFGMSCAKTQNEHLNVCIYSKFIPYGARYCLI
jgi:hypothetical protein